MQDVQEVSFIEKVFLTKTTEDGPEEKERERSEENPEKERSEKEDGQDGGSSATGSVVCILAELFMRLFGGSTDPSVITALMH